MVETAKYIPLIKTHDSVQDELEACATIGMVVRFDTMWLGKKEAQHFAFVIDMAHYNLRYRKCISIGDIVSLRDVYGSFDDLLADAIEQGRTKLVKEWEKEKTK